MYYELNIDQQTGNFRPIVIDDDGTTMEAEDCCYDSYTIKPVYIEEN